MLPIASQTAGPIGLNFFVDTQGWPGGGFDAKTSFQALELIKSQVTISS